MAQQDDPINSSPSRPILSITVTRQKQKSRRQQTAFLIFFFTAFSFTLTHSSPTSPLLYVISTMLLLTNSLSFLHSKRSLPHTMPSPPSFPFLNPNSRHLCLPPNPNSKVIFASVFFKFHFFMKICLTALVSRLLEE